MGLCWSATVRYLPTLAVSLLLRHWNGKKKSTDSPRPWPFYCSVFHSIQWGKFHSRSSTFLPFITYHGLLEHSNSDIHLDPMAEYLVSQHLWLLSPLSRGHWSSHYLSELVSEISKLKAYPWAPFIHPSNQLPLPAHTHQSCSQCAHSVYTLSSLHGKINLILETCRDGWERGEDTPDTPD